jgi:hypothetical protein
MRIDKQSAPADSAIGQIAHVRTRECAVRLSSREEVKAHHREIRDGGERLNPPVIFLWLPPSKPYPGAPTVFADKFYASSS